MDQMEDDFFNLGTLWMRRTTDGLAPQGEYARVSDFAQTSGTVTVPASALTAAPGAGDNYALATARYDLDKIIAAINACLKRIPVPTEDTTTLDTAQSQLEYNLPTTLLDEDIEVFLQTNTTDADSNMWVQTWDWVIDETGTGVAKILRFITQPPAAYAIKIRYYIPHAELWTYSAKLRESVPVMQVVYSAAALLLRDELNQMSSSDKALLRRINDLEIAARDWIPGSRRQSHKMATWGTPHIFQDIDD
jgi:hypothetical protein